MQEKSEGFKENLDVTDILDVTHQIILIRDREIFFLRMRGFSFSGNINFRDEDFYKFILIFYVCTLKINLRRYYTIKTCL